MRLIATNFTFLSGCHISFLLVFQREKVGILRFVLIWLSYSLQRLVNITETWYIYYQSHYHNVFAPAMAVNVKYYGGNISVQSPHVRARC